VPYAPTQPARRALRTITRVAVMSRTRVRARRTAAVLATAALGLTGCGVGDAGAAATVGDETVPVTDVEDYVRDYARQSGQDQLDHATATRAAQWLVQQRITMELVDRAARELDVRVTEAETSRVVRATRAQAQQQFPDYEQFVAQFFLTDELLPQAARAAAQQEKIALEILGREPRTQEEYQQAQSEAAGRIREVAEESGLDVTVNPRYGRWDGQTLVPGGGALVQTAQDTGAQGAPQPAP